MSINRFVKRLYLNEFKPYSFSFEITGYEKISIKKQEFPKYNKYLQLYHKMNNNDYKLPQNKKNEVTCKEFGNRGTGYYFANHGRFSLFNSCANIKGVRRVLICNIDISKMVKNDIHRYKSEVYSPESTSSEYVVYSPEFIYPIAAIEYKFCISELYFNNQETFIRDFDCEKCREFPRCNCSLPILESDII